MSNKHLHRRPAATARAEAKPRLTAAHLFGAMTVLFAALAGSQLLIGDRAPPQDRALAQAVDNGDIAAARAALAQGASVNQTNLIGSTPLHSAAWRGDLAMVQLLVAHGAGVNDADNRSGETPLHSAARGNQPRVARFLLEAGAVQQAKLHAANEQCNGTIYPAGSTALSIAEQSGFSGVAAAIKRHQTGHP